MIVRSATTRRLENLVTYGVVLTFAAFCLLPIIWLVLTSLKPESDIITSRGVVYIPSKLILSNYVSIWQQTDFPVLFRNSLVTTLITVALSLTAGTIAAYAFARENFRGRQGMLLGLLLLRMFPAVVKIIPLFIIMRGLGLLDTRFGLGVAYTSFLLPLFIWLMKGFFDAVPRDLEDAARIDGCTRLGALWRIILPIARNGIMATTVFIGIAAWNEFLFALILTTSSGSRTWPVGLQLMVGEFQLPWGMLAAGGVLSIIPVIILFAIVQRSMLRGLTEGATKG